MVSLNLPEFSRNIRKNQGRPEIFDIIRKKYVALTPEEWVRQHFLHFLINHLHYPKTLTRVESGLQYNRLSKRSDIVVYDRNINPFMIVECKSFEVKLNQRVMDQAAMYNRQLMARLLVITNGIKHYCVEYLEDGDWVFLSDISVYKNGDGEK